DELRAFAEESLGVETLHIWTNRTENTTLTWMFEFTAPPPLPHGTIADDAGATLSTEDIIQAGLEREMLQRWQGTRQYVHALYGERATTVQVTMYSRYNDFTYDRDVELDVRDTGGLRMFYDLRLPWWERFAFTKQEIASYAEEHIPTAEVDDKYREYDAAYDDDVNTRAGGEIERLAALLLGADFIATRKAWDPDAASYDLTQPPLLRYPRLWTPDDER
ncbi:MAG TPA: hypothetical protein VGS80_01370, partial [Ktedonobacterales bacterium]|nr:hypothetical protein [Ktedonobacterales bacterium]